MSYGMEFVRDVGKICTNTEYHTILKSIQIKIKGT